MAAFSICMLIACSACGSSLPSGPPSITAASPIPTTVLDPAPEVWSDRGRIVNRAGFEPSDQALIAAAGKSVRAVYRSVVGTTGMGTDVSGAFFIPRGDPPTGGWPIVSFAHGTTGLAADCGPSTHADLMGYSSAITGLLTQGYAVAFTDYEGLGTSGRHPFLEPRSAAYDVIDAVRALRALFAGVSGRWLAVGGSQGGQAAWAANEFDANYGEGLELVGVVAIAPAVNVSALSELAFTGALTGEQLGAVPLVVAGVKFVDPKWNSSAYLHGAVARDLTTIVGCGPESGPARASVSREDVKPETAVDAGALRDALRREAMPQRALSAPMLVVNGLKDKVVFAQWISSAVAQSCSMGGIIEHVEVADAGHDVDAGDASTSWIAARFAGEPAPSNCAGK